MTSETKHTTNDQNYRKQPALVFFGLDFALLFSGASAAARAQSVKFNVAT